MDTFPDLGSLSDAELKDLIHQLSDAATDVGSYWMTAWINAGRPQLPPQ